MTVSGFCCECANSKYYSDVDDNHIHIYNIVTCMSDYRRGFGLIIGFIGLFDTAGDYMLHIHTVVSTVTSSLAFAR
jgi:hypothetical protein